MISEVDIRDWDQEVKQGFTEYIRKSEGMPPYLSEVWAAGVQWAMSKSTVELRKVHEVNIELVQALHNIDMTGIFYNETPVQTVGRIRAAAQDALAIATGKEKDNQLTRKENQC